MKILVLGGGSSQISAIKRGQERGHKIVVSDQNLAAPGCLLVREREKASTFDPEGTLTAVKKYSLEGIVVVGTDQPVYTAAYVAENLGLDFPLSSQDALAVTNKKIMKGRMAAGNLPFPRYALLGEGFTDSDLKDLSFPLVIKPLDSQGQRGVRKVFSPDEIRESISETLSFSRQKEILAEEFYPHREVTVNGWVKEGRAYILAVSDRVTLESPPSLGVCVAHRFPSLYAEGREREIEELVKRIVKVFCLKKGPIYIQLFIGSAGILINEIACRLGGAYEDEWIPLVTGVDPLNLLYEEIETGTVREESLQIKPETEEPLCTTLLLFSHPGFVTSQGNIEEVYSLSGVRGGRYLLDPPVLIQEMRNSTQRAGYAIITAGYNWEMNERVGDLFNHFRFFDKLGNNLIWDTQREVRRDL